MLHRTPPTIRVGYHFNFVTAGKHKAWLSLLVKGWCLGEAAHILGVQWSSTKGRISMPLCGIPQPPVVVGHINTPFSFFIPPQTDNAGLFGESTDWWHHERLGVNCCYLGETCHLCSRCAVQILASSELLCVAALPSPAKGSGSFAKLPSHKKNHFCRSSYFALEHKNTHPHTKHKPYKLFIVMVSVLLFGWNLIIHIMSSLLSFPCIRQLWHSVYRRCRQCLMVSLLFFNLYCEKGLPLLHLVWPSVGIDWPLTFAVWLTERWRGRRTPRPYLARPGCSLVVATETETTCSGKLCSFF